METISNPLLRVADLDLLAELAARKLARHCWWTIPSLVLCWCALLSTAQIWWVESLTKFLAGHGDVLGGVVVTYVAHSNVDASSFTDPGPGAGTLSTVIWRMPAVIKTFALRCAVELGMMKTRFVRIVRRLKPDLQGRGSRSTGASRAP